MKTELVKLYKQSIKVWKETGYMKPDWAYKTYENACPFCDVYNPSGAHGLVQCVLKCPLSYGIMYGCTEIGLFHLWANSTIPSISAQIARAFQAELESDLQLLIDLGYTDDD